MRYDPSNYRAPISEEESEERARARKARYRHRKRNILLMRIAVIIVSLLIIAIAALAISSAVTGEAFSVESALSSVQKLIHAGTEKITGKGTQSAGSSGQDDADQTSQGSGAGVSGADTDNGGGSDTNGEADAGADIQIMPAGQDGDAQSDGSQGADQSGAGQSGDATDAGQDSDSAAAMQGTAQDQRGQNAQDAAAVSPAASADSQTALEQAALLAAGYDYDGAIAALEAVPGYESDSAITAAIAEYTQTRESCVAVDVTTVPHIFYHSLLNDTDRAFNVAALGQFAVDGMNAWMTTIEEFDKITQQLYDNGYVYVRLRDLVVETTNADGSAHFEPNTRLLLPPGKKALVLSVDDLSYYHSYEAAGFPEKLVIDENEDVKCRYTDAAGNTTLGDYDVVPRLNTFIAEHPDASYKGARGLIAMTGYNGCFGYRTDEDYELREHLMEDQAKWLEAHPDFDRQTEIAEATRVADALKSEGWEFASHTWGHLSVTGASVDRLRTDNEKWVANVQNIVGPVDTIIFAHGNDIGSWEGYSSDNEQYAYYKSAGYNFFCNVDGSTPYWVQIAADYVRQGRIDMDGYMLYQASRGETTTIDGLVTASQVFDQRRPTPVVANGQA